MSILNLSSINKIEKQVSSKMNPIVYPYGKNIFNKNTVTLDKYIRSTGELVSSSGWYVSDYIPVIANAYIILREVTTSTNAHCAFYDINKNIILDSLLDNNSLIGNNRVQIVPNNAAYFRFSNRVDLFAATDPSRMQVEYGVGTTKYEEYSAHPKLPNFISTQDVNIVKDSSIKNFSTGKNLFNKESVAKNLTINSNGVDAVADNIYVSNYIPIIGGAKIKLSAVRDNASLHSAFYDENKNVILDSVKANTQLVLENGIRVAPENASYFRFSNHMLSGESVPDKMQVEYGEETTEYESYSRLPRTPNFLEPQEVVINNGFQSSYYFHGVNLFDKSKVKEGVLIASATGLEIPNSNFYSSEYIGVIGGSRIHLRESTSSPSAGVSFYSDSKTFISGISNNDIIAKGGTVDVPNDAMFFRFSNSLSTSTEAGKPNGMQVEYGDKFTVFTAFSPLPKQPNFIRPQEVIDTDKRRSISFPHGKNLFNKETVLKSHVISEANGIVPSEDVWYVSDYIPVIGGSKIKLRELRPSDVGSAFYDENKNLIDGSFMRNFDAIDLGGVRYVPENASYFRFTNSSRSYNASIEGMQVEYGEHSTSYEPYSKLASSPNAIYPQDVVIRSEEHNIDGYEVHSDREKYQIIKHSYGAKIQAIHKNIAVSTESTADGLLIRVSENGITGDFDKKVLLNSTNFPDLIEGSQIESIHIIPYTRNMTNTQGGHESRIVIISDKGQIYHNYPARSTTNDGEALEGDIIKFDRSVVWELKGRKFPSKSKSASGVEKYMPCLPEANYQYDPQISKDNGYGNGGFPKQITHNGTTYARFYEPNKNKYHSFGIMGGYEPTSKLTLIGTYRSNNLPMQGSRTALFTTSDGGRSWYCKYEFASYSGDNNPGVYLDASGETFADYTADSFVVKKLTHTYPSEVNKEPDTLFNLGADVVISAISKEDKIKVTTKTNHGLSTNDIVVIKSNPGGGLSADWDWLKNDSITTSSGGNGTMFKVVWQSTTEFLLREYIHNPFNNLSCRHIHCINRIKDGFTLGCGEVYPEGWMFYIPMHSADTFGVIRAEQDLPLIRLNSSENSLRRPLGFMLLDDKDDTVIFGSDDSFLIRPNLSLPEGRTDVITRNSTGVYKGKLADFDDFTKYECILEATEPAYIFKEKLGVWIFGGSRGEALLSFDRGKSWEVDNFGSTLQYFKGTSGNKILVNDTFIILK